MFKRRVDSLTSSQIEPSKRRALGNATNLPLTPEKQRVLDFDIKPDDKAVRQLFPLSPPTTPTKPKRTSVYSQAKALFQRGYNDKFDQLVGREGEREVIDSFISTGLKKNICDSLYIAGPPGSGKTAQLDSSIALFNLDQKTCKVIKINCMILTNPNEIFQTITDELNTTGDLYETLRDGHNVYKRIMVVLDEIDYLLTKDQDILIKLFKLANVNTSSNLKTKLILIGISNSLDLTDKIVSKLEKHQVKAKTLNFRPYTFDKMKSIVITKLRSLYEENKENMSIEKDLPLIAQSAIILCCKKIASTTGDIRKCFDVLYKSIEMLETELLKTKSPSEVCQYDFLSAPKVSISHIAKTCNINYGNNILNKLTYLNQVILAYIFKFENGSGGNVNGFFDFYRNHDFSTKISKIKKSEFFEILINLESLSLIRLTGTANNIGLKTVQTNVNLSDFVKTITSDQLKKMID